MKLERNLGGGCFGRQLESKGVGSVRSAEGGGEGEVDKYSMWKNREMDRYKSDGELMTAGGGHWRFEEATVACCEPYHTWIPPARARQYFIPAGPYRQ